MLSTRLTTKYIWAIVSGNAVNAWRVYIYGCIDSQHGGAPRVWLRNKNVLAHLCLRYLDPQSTNRHLPQNSMDFFRKSNCLRKICSRSLNIQSK